MIHQDKLDLLMSSSFQFWELKQKFHFFYYSFSQKVILHQHRKRKFYMQKVKVGGLNGFQDEKVY